MFLVLFGVADLCAVGVLALVTLARDLTGLVGRMLKIVVQSTSEKPVTVSAPSSVFILG